VSTAASKHHAFVHTLSEIASDLGQLGPALDMLSQSETELSLPFTHMASALDRLKQLHLKHVQAEHVSGLSALLAFNAGMASALKEVLSNRDAALIQYQRASSALDSRTLERQKFQEQEQGQGPKPRRSGMLGHFDDLMYDPKRGSKIDTKVAQAPRRAVYPPCFCLLCSSHVGGRCQRKLGLRVGLARLLSSAPRIWIARVPLRPKLMRSRVDSERALPLCRASLASNRRFTAASAATSVERAHADSVSACRVSSFAAAGRGARACAVQGALGGHLRRDPRRGGRLPHADERRLQPRAARARGRAD